MICPKCSQKASIADRAYNIADGEMYRKHECPSCGYEFFTVEYEVIQNKAFEKAYFKAKYLDKSRPVKEKKPRENSKAAGFDIEI